MITPSPPGLRLRNQAVRVQLNTKLEIGLLAELRAYAAAMDSTQQDVLEAALRRYMNDFPPSGPSDDARIDATADGAGPSSDVGPSGIVVRLSPSEVARLAAGEHVVLAAAG